MAAVLLLALAALHFQAVPGGFGTESYLGVFLILAVITALAGVAAFLLDDRDRVWWYALAQGAANPLGYLCNRLTGLPLAGDVPERWYGARAGWSLVFLGVLLFVLALGVLIARHRRRRLPQPVLSADDRDLLSIPRPGRSGR
ncbi:MULTISPECIES: hypothetical protein [Thermomonosporaceae]|uniref:hypothetical protein n=1 Tax=Thermomonosporaceae TaxID=2012 RepID=UPI00255A96AC|nr:MULTISPECIES: hypothetical protein [Thermomonosporaceae]MDL4776099.1 hypothetical protein [Actinomadura xylanilytica]